MCLLDNSCRLRQCCLCAAPVAGFFEVESVNKAWIKAHVNMLLRWSKHLMRAETCYRGDIRFWNMSVVKVTGALATGHLWC